ncbi:MAG: hypothetical protein KKD38_01155 [Candidatus Delongbacteria bacterium]|nr:hypothetical protein [Candidatus Delongbacteria bacterium]MCG2759725.1 hypothetical protein [Candidatus Delongbacteria bacterium]
MAELTRNSKENTLEIYQGFHKSKFIEDMEPLDMKDSDVVLLKGKKRIEGVKINNFFETTEIAAYIAENELKKIFERKQYKSVYTGNFMQISERATDFYLDIGKTRPDFLVKIPNIGKVFVDVKCRKLYEINGDFNSRYFNLNKEEIGELLQIQTDMDIPVWIAVKDFGKFDSEKRVYKDADFYFISVSILNSFAKKMNFLNGASSNTFYSYKIPAELFKKDNKLSSFSFDNKFDKELLKLYSNMMINSVEEIRSAIFKAVEDEEFYKSYLPYILCGYYSVEKVHSKYNGALSHLTPQDINSVLWKMIEDKEIEHIKGKPLFMRHKKN